MSFCVNKAGTNHPARVSGLAKVQGGSAVGKGLEVCATCVHFTHHVFFLLVANAVGTWQLAFMLIFSTLTWFFTVDWSNLKDQSVGIGSIKKTLNILSIYFSVLFFVMWVFFTTFSLVFFNRVANILDFVSFIQILAKYVWRNTRVSWRGG